VLAPLSAVDQEGPLADDEAAQMKQTGTACPRKIPFLLLVQEVIGLDITLPLLSKFLGKTTLKLHCACSNWSDVSEEIEAAKGSRIAHWINVKWRIPVTFIKNSIRLTLWCGNRNLGYCVLPVHSMLEIPCDRTGRSEIFAKIYASSPASSSTGITLASDEMIGRLRIVCRFDVNGFVDKSAKMMSRPLQSSSQFKNRNVEDGNEEEEILDYSANILPVMDLTGGSFAFDERERLAPYIQELKRFSRSADRAKIEFPAQFTMKSVSVIDLIPIHRLTKNSPEVRFICDRVTGFTDVSLHR
jgi:hypothetical protein